MNIYVSTVAFAEKNISTVIEDVKKRGWALEFSSGLPFIENMEEIYLNAPIKRIPHNYFPAPKVPFVLNLASENDAIRKQSLDHCKRLLIMTKRSGADFFAAHAGFCIDPNPNELGKKFNYKPIFDKEVHKGIFLDSVRDILKTADEYEVDFFIENNVVAAFNVVDDVNPLLCCESVEINWLFDTIRHKHFGLLLDTAHLKVSCQTLGLPIHDEYSKIKHLVKAIHHSDNNGLEDNNQLMNEDYWFLPYIGSLSNYPHVIEVKHLSFDVIERQINLLQRYGS